MILVTGGTGFIGNVLVRNLVSLGYPIRLLINPSTETPRLPPGLAVDVAISGFDDERSVRASLKGVKTIFHLIGTESRGITMISNASISDRPGFSRNWDGRWESSVSFT